MLSKMKFFKNERNRDLIKLLISASLFIAWILINFSIIEQTRANYNILSNLSFLQGVYIVASYFYKDKLS